MIRLTEVVKQILIINVLVFLAQMTLGNGSFVLMYPADEAFRPYQILTHMFMHGGFTHILFNMFSLAMFGPPVEARIGPKKFLFYYLFCGVGAAILQLFVIYLEFGFTPVQYGMLGASGAIFGILAAFGWYFPNVQMQMIFPPVAMRAKYMVILFGVLELVMGVGGYAQGIAHFAHIGGAVFGLLLILYWRKFDR
ncbi:MAG TPA: rhomboid family intramembrane serine protease [Saprospiraceae bacterium]|jgi:membrane associated rhomboid family serine protease|nr:rhomboid family intramembrane serine protease [Saprospiraceae bacterium]MCC6688978.1 rhomboid family intramembrane serine protease [Saprospiraceae bacterium]HMV23022.1 rhomboid family intramembrane serine protease [Saprospiraceae bacterium]HMX83999.1 rhomboid family intramembrane serine protease [Saprospiraceae bacterium]HMX85992.1 rhomboid family intramembrane serine protease [Saprospiraceae bacterium]